MTIEISNVSMYFGSKQLFADATLQLKEGHRYGLVGANGSGKSTFLSLLTGEGEPRHGTITLAGGLTVGTLRQDHFLYEGTPLTQVVLQGRPLLWESLQAKERLLEGHEGPWSDEQCRRLEELEQTIVHEGGYGAEAAAAKLLEGLGIDAAAHSKPLSLLSGGYKLRVLLAQLLFAAPRALLLDEPTNHLDLYSIRWLEEYLKGFKGLLVLCSHDRAFLDAVTTDILDIDYGGIRHYPMGFEAFLRHKAEVSLQQEQALASQARRRDQLQTFVDRFGAKATKARQAHVKKRQIEEIEEAMDGLVNGPTSRRAPALAFLPARRGSAMALSVQGLSKSYGDNVVLKDVSLEVARGAKVAFVGVNGIGKTTLLEALTGGVRADCGTVRWGATSEWVYFPQDPARLLGRAAGATALEWLCGAVPAAGEQRCRDALGRLLLSGDQQRQRTDTLSGGEKARLVLAMMLLREPNVLIFDEPTNHLDMESIEALSQAIEDFEETVLLVSHNRWFVSRCSDRVVELTKGGIVDFPGGYEDFVRCHQKDLLVAQQAAKGGSCAAKEEQKAQHQQRRDEQRARERQQRRLEALERQIAEVEASLSQLEGQMADPLFYSAATPQPQRQETLRRKDQLEGRHGALLQEWEALYEEG